MFARLRRYGRLLAICAGLALTAAAAVAEPEHSVARRWNEVLLQAIRNDFARPPLHARNLYHVTVAMWDAWAAYDEAARTVLADEHAIADDIAAARHEAISYAAYRVLYNRYRDSPGAYESLTSFDDLMAELGYDPDNTEREGPSPAALGNRIGNRIIDLGYDDGADELGSYAFEWEYRAANRPMVVAHSGSGTVHDPNRWQPLALRLFVDQAGRQQPGGVQRFIGSHWGAVTPFALSPDGMVDDGVYLDPGPPPYLGGDRSREYQMAFAQVVHYGATLTPDDGVLTDISPGAFGNNSLGANDGRGHPLNPVTGDPYAPNVVKRGDWARVIAEFWADGPDSETPPGHWNTLANYVTDHPELERRLGGTGDELDPLEWDLKLYLALNGAVHDAAVCAWGLKGHYDYVRPITAIRYMAGLGQSSDPELPSYHEHGLPLHPGLVEVVTSESAAAGERHAHLAEHVGSVAVYGWLGQPEDPETQYSGVGWILAVEWLPYQRDTFVTPPFAGYISGHSTFSRAAAEVMTLFTGSEFFPGGLGEFVAPAHDFLVFESGPTETVTLQWATYYDASDEAGISRLYGGIHPWVDDLPGRIIGSQIGIAAFEQALAYFGAPS